ncbi:hypothetical protein ACQP2P_38955 [Dactylosporangium sp. CA-139114]|uniref:hypothetical protein n=1 Tax=Dactylosporangium sp. CA-139114 TaxID=3239931 RepID=UPI003D96D8B9
MRKVLGSATVMYLSALGMSGAAILLSIALPPDERGLLVATTTSASLGVAIGGFSLESFLLAQGRGWLGELSGRRSLLIYLATVPISAVLAWAFALYSAEASPLAAAIGAVCIAASTVPAAAGLTLGEFLSVYRHRAVYAAAAPLLYVVLIAMSVRTGESWLMAWLACQVTMAVGLWAAHGAVLLRMGRRPSLHPERLDRMAVTHVGAIAVAFNFRFDQLALARYQGADQIAVYSLAVAAIEFAQSGAVVAAQRTLGDHEEGSADRMRGVLRRSLLLAVGLGALVLVGLAGIGLLTDGYEMAFLVGLVLLPRSIAVAADKVFSARLVNLHRERTATLLAIVTAVAAVVGYSLAAPRFGLVGVAAVSSVLFVLHSIAAGAALRAGRPAPASRPDPTVREPEPTHVV